MIGRDVILSRLLPALVVLVTVAIVLYFWLWRYDPRAFRGDGALVETGPLYPRYRIVFERVPLSGTVHREYRFIGSPREAFTLELEIACKDVEALNRNETRLSCTLSETDGVQVCMASGTLREWVLRQSAGGCGFWHRSFRDVRLVSGKAYILEIDVDSSAAAAAGEGVTAVPVLSGGGYETP